MTEQKPQGIDPYPVKLDVAKTLLDLADKDLTRLHATALPDARARCIFYRSSISTHNKPMVFSFCCGSCNWLG
nr:MAG TPA: hypothetical protein [Caudoviricetes sp.]